MNLTCSVHVPNIMDGMTVSFQQEMNKEDLVTEFCSFTGTHYKDIHYIYG